MAVPFMTTALFGGAVMMDADGAELPGLPVVELAADDAPDDAPEPLNADADGDIDDAPDDERVERGDDSWDEVAD